MSILRIKLLDFIKISTFFIAYLSFLFYYTGKENKLLNKGENNEKITIISISITYSKLICT